MARSTLTKIGLLVTIAGVLLAAACAEGEVQRSSQTVKRGSAQSVRTEITMAAGKLNISGDADALLDADFVYSVADWKPKVDYSVSGNEGTLTIQQPVSTDVRLGNVRYEWDLRLNNEVPMDLRVKLGAGENKLALSGLTLTNLDIVMGTGNVTVDLTGGWERDFDARLRGGLGKATLRLPQDVGVNVKVQGGLGQLTAVGLRREEGAYVNEAYGESAVTLDIEVQGGAGAINLEVSD